jgi:HEAT repeat protein
MTLQKPERNNYSPKLVELLSSPDVDIVVAAMGTLGNFGSSGAANSWYIAGLLTDERKAVRYEAVSVLGELKASDHAGACAVLLRDQSPDVRERAAWALSRFGMVGGYHLLGEDDTDLRRTAISVLREGNAKDLLADASVAEIVHDAAVVARIRAGIQRRLEPLSVSTDDKADEEYDPTAGPQSPV